jgi:hypothetical protein
MEMLCKGLLKDQRTLYPTDNGLQDESRPKVMKKVPLIFIALLALVVVILFNSLWLYLHGPNNGRLLLGINILFLALILGLNKHELTSKAGASHEEDPAFAVQDRLTKLLSDEQKNQDDT